MAWTCESHESRETSKDLAGGIMRKDHFMAQQEGGEIWYLLIWWNWELNRSGMNIERHGLIVSGEDGIRKVAERREKRTCAANRYRQHRTLECVSGRSFYI